MNSSRVAQRSSGESSSAATIEVILGRTRAAPVAPLLLGVVLAATLAANGGYFPTTWGWLGVGLAWAVAVAALFRPVLLSRADATCVAALAALTAWTAVSAAWSADSAQTGLETERLLALLAGVVAALALRGRGEASRLLAAVGFGAAAVCAYALSTRLFPDRLGVFDPIAGYRLSTPVGYWNSLGLVAACGLLLALAAVAASGRQLPRSAAAAAVPVLAVTLYFTYSRGAWIALFVGSLTLLVVERRRAVLLVRASPTMAAAAAAVALAAHERALTHVDASAAAAAHDGHRFAALLVMLALAAALGAAGASRVGVRTVSRRAGIGACVVVTALAVALVTARFGPPPTLARDAYRAFVAPPPSTGGNLNARLFSLSGSGRWTQWRVALDAFVGHPLLGIGAGGYERYWLRLRHEPGKIRDAHSLYVETLAETGIVGFFLLVTVLAAPFFALRRARRTPLASGGAAAYAAYLVHAGVDWDWELAGVTLLALLCGSALLVAGRPETARPLRRAYVMGGAVATGVVALVGLAGNLALARAGDAARAGDWAQAERDARAARTWASWSSQPWQQLGEAQLGAGDSASARISFRDAIAKSPGDWSLWFDLARASTGAAQAQALAHAQRLNPLSPEIRELRAELAAQGRATTVEK